MPSQLYQKRDFERYLSQMGLMNHTNSVFIFQTFDGALEWMEEQLLQKSGITHSGEERALELREFQLFRDFSPMELESLSSCLITKAIPKGELIVRHGDTGDEIFLVRRGSFRALLPLAGGREHHLATFEQGSFFGELAFLDHDIRSANIEAKTNAEVFVLSRSRFNTQSLAAPQLGAQVFARLAAAIALRLRITDQELRVAEDR
jgi:SulP family sulfate permease